MADFKVTVFTDKDTTVDELLKPFGINEKVKKYLYKTKQEVIKEEKKKIQEAIENHKYYIESLKNNIDKRQKSEKIIEYLHKLKASSDEEIYQYAIQDYDKSLISKNGNIYKYYNPWTRWCSYTKNGDFSKMLVIERSGEFIHVNSAKCSEIVWDFVKYGAIFTEVTLFPNGTWIDEKENERISVTKSKTGKLVYTMIDGDSFEANIPQDWNVTIVECYI